MCSTSVMFCICLDRPVMNQEQEPGTCIGKLNRGSFDFHVSQTAGISSENSFEEISQTVLIFAKSATWRF